MIFVGIMGHGTVGSGVAEVLFKNAENIARRTGAEICIKRILDLRDFPDLPYRDLFTKRAEDLLEDPEIRIIVEVMGGLHPAYAYTKQALLSGRHVVTSNKELVAQHGAELTRIAQKQNVNYLYEASVGGGIPIIRPLKQCLAGNEITEVCGILNGTTNYILTQMKDHGVSFDKALADAQAMGYAEKDPTADIEGHDSQRKLAILAGIAFGQQIQFSDISTEGISHITLEDMHFAQELGYVIKLVAQAVSGAGTVGAWVCPMLLKRDHPLADVEGVFNAILVKGDAIGDVMFYGRGAGKLPTASAVVGDIMDAAKHLDRPKQEPQSEETSMALLDASEMESGFFLRLSVAQGADTIARIKAYLADCTVVLSEKEGLRRAAALLTPVMRQQEFEALKEGLYNVPGVLEIKSVLRVLPQAEESLVTV